MSEERAKVRKDLVTRLMGKTIAQNRVFASRAIDLPKDLLAAIIVTADRETATSINLGGSPTFRHTLTVQIEAIVAETKNMALDDRADSLATQIETVLLTDPEWVKKFEKISFESHELAYREEGERLKASVLMRLQLEYVLEHDPAIADDFVTAQVDVDSIDPADPNTHPPDGTYPEGYGGDPGPDKRKEASATFTLEQNP